MAVAALLVAGAPATAAPKRISGKLTKPGYTVVALADDGEAVSTGRVAKRFRLVPPAKRVSLHLRAADGTYAGPVVLRKNGKLALVGLKRGAKLGKVKVKRAEGYAKPKRKLSRKRVDRDRKARAKRGVPIGAGNFGHVRAKNQPGAVSGDGDVDGIPDPLDVDDDGDLVLDSVDGSPGNGPSVRALADPSGFRLNPYLPMLAEQTANSHIGSSDAEIEQTLPAFGRLAINVLPGGPAEIDCGGLSYCSSGGSGRIFEPGVPFDEGPPFPDCCDSDGDGFGEPTPNQQADGLLFFDIAHFADTSQIGTGDQIIQHVATGGDVSACPPPAGTTSEGCATYTATLPFVFASAPALAAYRPETGPEQTVSYPLSDPLTVEDGPDADSDVSVALTFFRPQRRPTPGEPGHRELGAWIDLGGLEYTVTGVDPPGSSTQGSGVPCTPAAFDEADDELELLTAPERGGVSDSAPDRPSSTPDTLTYTLNITRCLDGAPWNSGEEVGLGFEASKISTSAEQSGVYFKLP